MNKIFKSFVVASATAALISSSAFAGGLSDEIVEREVEEMQEVVPAGSVPGWVIPVVAIVVIGALIAASKNDDDPEPAAEEESEGFGECDGPCPTRLLPPTDLNDFD